jgi:chromosome partitioning protein
MSFITSLKKFFSFKKNRNTESSLIADKSADLKENEIEIRFLEKPEGDPVRVDSETGNNSNINNNNDKGKDLKYMSRIIAIANQKGGVGKSTTAVNMSSYLGELGYKTLLIDFDPQSNSTSGLGIEKDKIKKNIYDVIISGEEAKNAIIETGYKNLYMIPATIQLAGAEVELVSAMKREYKLKGALNHVKSDFDFIIIDCPPALGLLTINALTAADEVLIPIQCEYYALEGLGQLVNTINLIKENLNESLKINGVVMTMFDQRTRLSEQVIEEVRAYFPDRVYKTIIPRNVRLSEAPSYGKPISEYDPVCKGAQAYKNLTEEVIKNGAE